MCDVCVSSDSRAINALTGAQLVKTTDKKGQPTQVFAGHGVIGFLINAAVATRSTAAITEKTAAPPIKTALPIEHLSEIGASPAGEVFVLDAGSIATMNVRIKKIVDPNQGAGLEMHLRLSPAMAGRLESRLSQEQIKGAAHQPYLIPEARFEDGVTKLSPDQAYSPSWEEGNGDKTVMQARFVNEPGKFVAEYVPRDVHFQAYRQSMRIRVFAKSDAELRGNLEAVAARLEMPELIADADPAQQQRLLRMSALRMVNPKQAENIAQNFVQSGTTLEQLDRCLAQNGVEADRVAQLHLEEVFPGQVAAVDPSLGDAYAKLGVKAVTTQCSVDGAVTALAKGGLLSTVERFARGVQVAGMSITADEKSGGAEFAFARLLPENAFKGNDNILSFYGGQVQLLCVGQQMKELLSRTDWHAYAEDCYGITVSDAQINAGTDEETKNLVDYVGHFSNRPVLGDLINQVNTRDDGGFAKKNEACFKTGIKADAWTMAVVYDDKTKQEFVTALRAAGINQLGGLELEKAIVVARTWKGVAERAKLE